MGIRKLKVSEPLLYAGLCASTSFIDITIFPGRDWFPQFTDEEREAQEGKSLAQGHIAKI